VGIAAGRLDQRVLIKLEGFPDRVDEGFDSAKLGVDDSRSFSDDNAARAGARAFTIRNNKIYTVNDEGVHVYDLAGNYESSVALSSHNSNPYGIAFALDNFFYVLDREDRKAYAYFNNNYSPSFDRNLAPANANPYGLTVLNPAGHAPRFYVSDTTDKKIYAYGSTFGAEYRQNEDIDLHSDNDSPAGIFTDGTHMWVTDGVDDHIYAYAYNLQSAERVPGEDLRLLDFFTATAIAVSGLFILENYIYVLDITNSARTNIVVFKEANPLNKIYKVNISRFSESYAENPIGTFSAGALRMKIRKDSYTKRINLNTLIVYNDKNYRVTEIMPRTSFPYNLIDITIEVYNA